MSDAGVLRARWRARTVTLRLRSDDGLARHAALGDTDAFAVLYERHHGALYRYCRSIVADPDDAADALQSTMARALAAIGARDEAAPVRAWLFRIAHNESISLVRRRRGSEPLDPETLIGPDVEADADRRSRLAQLVADLQQLSERQRGALLMRELSGLGHAEIAAAFEMSEGAVKQAIFEARTALHDLAAGREMTCDSVRRRLSDGDGRTARSRHLRGHLRSCDDCRTFRDELRVRRSELGAIAPVLPAATAAAVLDGVIGGGGGGGLLAGVLSKTVAVGAVTAAAGAGAVTFTAAPPRVQPSAEPAQAAKAAPGGPDGQPGSGAPVEPEDASARTDVERVSADAGGDEPARGDRGRRVDEDADGRVDADGRDRGSSRRTDDDRRAPGKRDEEAGGDPGESGERGDDRDSSGKRDPDGGRGGSGNDRDDEGVPAADGDDNDRDSAPKDGKGEDRGASGKRGKSEDRDPPRGRDADRGASGKPADPQPESPGLNRGHANQRVEPVAAPKAADDRREPKPTTEAVAVTTPEPTSTPTTAEP